MWKNEPCTVSSEAATISCKAGAPLRRNLAGCPEVTTEKFVPCTAAKRLRPASGTNIGSQAADRPSWRVQTARIVSLKSTCATSPIVQPRLALWSAWWNSSLAGAGSASVPT